jgi:hypothetical protein
MTMKNFIESLLNFVKITVNYLVKNKMLKWERQGGGDISRGELRTVSENY